jgi:hypothetical protein
MLNRLLDLILCGDYFPCDGTMCSRWLDGVPPMTGDQRPCESTPPIPAVVKYPQCQYDNVSLLYESSLHSPQYELRIQKLPDDLDLSVEQSSHSEREGYRCGDMETSSTTVIEIDRQFFDELYYTPLRSQRSDHYQFNDGDGSSYSTNCNFISAWKTEGTDTTRLTNHTLVRRYSAPSGTQVSV